MFLLYLLISLLIPSGFYTQLTFTHTWKTHIFNISNFLFIHHFSSHFSNMWFPNWPLNSHILLGHQEGMLSQSCTECWQLPCPGAQLEFRMMLFLEVARVLIFSFLFSCLILWLPVFSFTLLSSSTVWPTSTMHLTTSSNMHLAEMWLRLTYHPVRCSSEMMFLKERPWKSW